MAITIDARGLSCPQPVIKTKKALEESELPIDIIVDNKAASENIARFAFSQGYLTTMRQDDRDFIVTIMPSSDAPKTGVQESQQHISSSKQVSTIVVIASDSIGQGDDVLGRVLMKAFLNTLREQGQKPQHIIFMNNGVKLTVDQSEFLEDVTRLEQAGIQILVCGTCLDFFHLKELVRVGTVSNFFEITQLLLTADKVIRL